MYNKEDEILHREKMKLMMMMMMMMRKRSIFKSVVKFKRLQNFLNILRFYCCSIDIQYDKENIDNFVLLFLK